MRTGGSTQITWMIAKDGHVETSSKGSISFPYGAAAMTRKLAELGVSEPEHKDRHKSHSPVKTPRQILKDDMKAQFQQAYHDLDLPDSLRQKAQHGGLNLYLSGGGFRGWGYLLMSQHKVSPYPIPIINGFCVTKRDFQQIDEITTLAAEQSVFRISQRRAKQVPAVAFLVNVLVEALPMIQVRICGPYHRRQRLISASEYPFLPGRCSRGFLVRHTRCFHESTGSSRSCNSPVLFIIGG
jgi:retrograde regulation protein 2